MYFCCGLSWLETEAMAGSCEHGNKLKSGSIKAWEFILLLSN
jgi:hypothetical protein